MEKVDVVIPLYNGSKWINETLRSVLEQTLEPNRIIVVDDGSTDGSITEVSKFPQVTLVRNSVKGPASARNFGFKFTKAPFVAFLDQDDVWHPNHLKILYDVFMTYPEVGAVTSFCQPFTDGTQPQFDVSDAAVELADPWVRYPFWLAAPPSSNLFRRQTLEKLNWPVEHDGVSDYSLWMKLSISNKVAYVSAKTLAYRIHDSSHWMVLQRDPLSYLNLWLRTVDDVFHYRSNIINNSREKLFFQRRNLVAHEVIDLLCGIKNGDGKPAKKSALRLDKMLTNESEVFSKLPLEFIMDSLYSIRYDFLNRSCEKSMREGYAKRHGCYKRLLEFWPNEARRTKKILINIIVEKRPGLNFYLDYYFSKPWQLKRLRPFFVAVDKKITCSFHGDRNAKD